MSRQSTTDKHDVSRAIFLERLLKSWEKAPEMRLGQLIIEALSAEPMELEPFIVITLRHIPDSQLAEAIERYVLTRVP